MMVNYYGNAQKSETSQLKAFDYLITALNKEKTALYPF